MPLSSLAAALEALKHDAGIGSESRDMLRMARVSLDLVGGILDGVLDLQRLGRGDVKLRKKWIPVTKVLHDVVAVMRPLAEDYGSRLVTRLNRTAGATEREESTHSRRLGDLGVVALGGRGAAGADTEQPGVQCVQVRGGVRGGGVVRDLAAA